MIRLAGAAAIALLALYAAWVAWVVRPVRVELRPEHRRLLDRQLTW